MERVMNGRGTVSSKRSWKGATECPSRKFSRISGSDRICNYCTSRK